MSASDIVQPIVTEITKSVVEVIRQELDYILRSKKYVNKLKLQVQSLVNGQTILQSAVVEAQKLGKAIKPEVLQWLGSASDIIVQAEELLKDSNRRCLNRWCIDFGLRYKTNKGAIEISEIISGFPPVPESTSVALPDPPATVESDSDFMEFESNNGKMQQIMQALKDKSCGIVGVFGMGGIGKTTMVKKIAERVKQDRQFDQVVMAVVSQSPNLKKIQGQIASMLDLEFKREADVLGRASQLRGRIMNLKSILVILDDVWAHLSLGDIGIPDFVKHNGCKVMLTTRSEDVCTAMATGKYKVNVGNLSVEESWEFFKRNAGDDALETSPLKEVAMDVMKECQGLPIALKTVGLALLGKDIRHWESAKLQLKKFTTANIEGMNKNVMSCLRLSYDYLESQETKECFLLCCLFPEDIDISMEILVRYAIGRGLFQYACTIDEVRTLAKTTLRKLKASCLLLEGDGKEEECVKLHDVVRDVGLSIASEGNLLGRTGPGLRRWLLSNSMKHIKGASFVTDEVVSLPEGHQCAQLEELCLFAENVDYSDAFFETMKELNVLIHVGHSRLPKSVKCLRSLKTLYLSECELGDISALGELKNLEILSLTNTDIESLPMEVGQLTGLRLLDITRNYGLEIIPAKVISRLSQLEELYISERFDNWEVEGTCEMNRSASLLELQSLPCLAILSVRVRDFTSIPPNFSLPKLVKFDIRVGEHYPFQRYPTSRTLTLGNAKCHPEGVESFLHLADTNNGQLDCRREQKEKWAMRRDEAGNEKYILTDLSGGELNGLNALRIESNDWIASLTSAATKQAAFANLQVLILKSVDSLTGLGSGIGVLPRGSLQQLRVLRIELCYNLKDWVVPWSWIHRLHKLEKVHITHCSSAKGLLEDNDITTTGKSENDSALLLLTLREIWLYDLNELLRLSNGTPSVNFSSLTAVQIFRCDKLVSIFAPNVSQSLVHLETLRISRCSHLKVIFDVGDSSEEIAVTFPNLKIVSIVRCRQLRSLFTVSMAKGLLKLEELVVCDNFGLEEIVSCNKNRAEAEEEMENAAQSCPITWPEIRRIDIQDSKNLKRFCPRNCSMDMPLLQEFSHISYSHGMKNCASDAAPPIG